MDTWEKRTIYYPPMTEEEIEKFEAERAERHARRLEEKERQKEQRHLLALERESKIRDEYNDQNPENPSTFRRLIMHVINYYEVNDYLELLLSMKLSRFYRYAHSYLHAKDDFEFINIYLRDGHGKDRIIKKLNEIYKDRPELEWILGYVTEY